MRFFCTFSGGLAAFLSILLLSGCGGGSSTSTPPPAPPPPPNPVQVTVTLSGSGSGTVTSTPAGIDCGKTCSQTFSAGTQVTLNATPATGFTFAGWSGACTGTGACTLPTTGAQSVTASFGTTVASLQSINHIIFMVQENRGFDHFFGHLNGYRTAPPYNLPPDVDGTPANASNPSADGLSIVTPFLMNSVCVENQSPSWNESHTDYNLHNTPSATALMDGFFYISSKDAPSNGGFALGGTLFSMFTYAQGPGLQNIVPASQFLTDAANGTLPQVAMIEPGYASGTDEHPAANTPGGNIQQGAEYVSSLINGLMKSPSWSDSVFILTWDEGGGFYDHVPPMTTVKPDITPPSDLAGPPNPDICYQNATAPTCDFDYTGFRVPMILVSPFANKNSVSHVPRDYTSILKLIEKRFGLTSLTLRDAAQPDMDEFFDFVNVPWKTPPSPPVQPRTGLC